MANISKAAVNRGFIARTVISALRTQGPQMATALEAHLYAGRPPATLTLQRLIEDLADHLEKRTERASELSSGVLTEAAQDVAATRALAERAEVLRDEIQWQRNQISGTYGSATAAAFGYAGTIPQSAGELDALSKVLEDRLRNNDFPAQTRRGRRPLDRREFADLLADARAELAKAADQDARETRETQQARQTRDQATDDWDTDYQGVANAAVGLFQIARMPALAERVRPTGRRRRQLPEDIDLQVPADPGPAEQPAAPPQPTQDLEEEAID